MKILVTGFEPFGGESLNTSWEAVRGLPERMLLPEFAAEAEIVKRQLPVSYRRVGPCLNALLSDLRPDAVLCVGQAAGRAGLTPEKVAINWQAAATADNDGTRCAGEYIIPGGAAAYFATLPVEKMAEAMQTAAIPAQVSYTAGTYVCNCAMYALLDALAAMERPVWGGFLHVPCTCSQAARSGVPCLPLDTIVQGLTICVETIARRWFSTEAFR